MNSKKLQTKVESIIHSAAIASSAAAASVSLTPIPDATMIVPIQINMINELADVYGLDKHDSAVQKALAPIVATASGKSIANWLIGKLPGFGAAINGATAFSVTEALGWSVATSFESVSNNEA